MALIECTECKKEVSSEAANCPHCGVRIKAKPKIWRWVFGVPLGGFALIMIIGSMAGGPEADEKARNRDVIAMCLKDMNDPLRDAMAREAARAVCERLRDDFRQKYRAEP